MADQVEQQPPTSQIAAVDLGADGPLAAETGEGGGDDGATPAVTGVAAEDEVKSKKVTLADICAKATALYAHKNYDEAANLFGKAADMQAEINGEMAPENAEILFLYGRTMFKVGQAKSDVLGGAAAEDKKKKKKTKKAAPKAEDNAALEAVAEEEEKRVTEEGVAIIAEQKEGEKKAETVEEKPMFQFEGDDNIGDVEEEDAEEEEDDEEEDDELTIAFEVLDLAKVLFQRRLEAVEKEADVEKGKGTGEAGANPTVSHIKERLGDCHDLLAELSLEQERYPAAIDDFRGALRYKKELHAQESEIIAEAHYKLSLALEFASVTTTGDEGGGPAKTEAIDQELRDEAARELEAAIASTRLKLQNKEVDLAMMSSPEDNEASRRAIADVKEMLADLEQRLVDLRRGPLDVNEALYGKNGLLGAALGESASEQGARVEEAKKNATDLSGLVRKKQKSDQPAVKSETAATNGQANGKRKAEEPAEDIKEEDSKKARVEESAAAAGTEA